MSFPTYAEYKKSGVKWLGSIPSHWEVIQSRRLFRARREAAKEDDVMLTASQKYGMIPQAEFVEKEGRRVVEVIQGKENLIHVEPDDFVISMRSFQGGLEWCRYTGSTSFHYVPVTPIKNVVPSFFAHLLKSAPYISALRSTTNLIRDGQEIRYSNFVQAPLPVVPKQEQLAIADFLDRETAKIDALIAEQQRLIELLQEKRQAVISHAVTKGLNPNAPMKDSGVEWLGEVPEHWEVKQVRHLVKSLSQGSSPSCLQEPAGDDEYGVLKVGCVNEIAFLPMENKKLPPEIEPDLASLVKPGDVLVSRGNTKELVGLAALATEAPQRLLASDLIFVLRTRCRQIHPQFLTLALRSKNTRAQIEPRTVGTSPSMQKINQSTLKEILVAVPPLAEQQEIIDVLNEWNGSSEKGIHDSRLAIQLLQERRSALISAAVTGQIDVRGLGPEDDAA